MNNSTVGKSAERVAGAVDKLIGFGVALAINLAEEQRSRRTAEYVILTLQMLRVIAINLLDKCSAINSQRLIHNPELPAAGLLDFEQTNAQSSGT